MKLIIYFCSILVSVLASGDLIILSQPEGIAFKGNEGIEQSILTELFSAALGFTTEKRSGWSGMYLTDPFKLAKAVVNVVIDGVNDIGTDFGHHFPLYTDENELVTFESLEQRIKIRHPDSKSKLIHLNLDDGTDNVKNVKLFDSVEPKKIEETIFLKPSSDEDLEFLNELALLNGIVDVVESGVLKKGYTPDVIWFVMRGLHAVSDFYGADSSELAEAKELLVASLNRLNDVFKKAYDGEVLITVITSDVSHTRQARELKLSERILTQDDIYQLKLSSDYDQTWPVFFNIFLWFGLIMFFSLVAICVAIGTMDPGRDSIIYRMTSTRMKKDN